MRRPGFWDDADGAAQTSAAHARAQRKLELFRGLESDAGDLAELAELATEDDDMGGELEEQLGAVEARLAALEEERLFGGPEKCGPGI